nr:unnamed protein product [Digitaria exilis]
MRIPSRSTAASRSNPSLRRRRTGPPRIAQQPEATWTQPQQSPKRRQLDQGFKLSDENNAGAPGTRGGAGTGRGSGETSEEERGRRAGEPSSTLMESLYAFRILLLLRRRRPSHPTPRGRLLAAPKKSLGPGLAGGVGDYLGARGRDREGGPPAAASSPRRRNLSGLASLVVSGTTSGLAVAIGREGSRAARAGVGGGVGGVGEWVRARRRGRDQGGRECADRGEQSAPRVPARGVVGMREIPVGLGAPASFSSLSPSLGSQPGKRSFPWKAAVIAQKNGRDTGKVR